MRQHGGDPERNAHLGLQRALEGAGMVAARIVGRGEGHADGDGADRRDIGADHLDHAQRRLAGGLREVTGRRALVIDGEDLGLAAREERDRARHRLPCKGREEACLAVEDVAAAIGAGLGEAHRHDGVARSEAGMEEHVRGAARRPLVEP